MFFKVFFSTFIFIATVTANTYSQNVDDGFMENDEFPLLFSIDSNDGIPTNESIDNYITVITPEEHKLKAEEYIKKGLYKQALMHIKNLKESSLHSNYAKYLKAVVLSQQGSFESAYKQLNDIVAFGGEFNSASRNIQAELALKLAWISLNQKNLSKATMWLERYNPEKETNALERKYNYISDVINVEKIKSFNNENSPSNSRPLKVALLLPLSGVYQNMGQNMLEAAQLALFMHPNSNILLYPHDTQSTQTGARLAAQKAINDRANIILGPLTSAHTEVIQRDAAAAGIPILSFSSDTSLVNRNTHVFGHQKGIQAVQAAKVIADLDISTTAILAPNTPYGISMSKTFQEQAALLDISITQIAYFDPKSTDQSKELKILTQEAYAINKLKKERKKLKREFSLVGAAMNDVSLKRLEELKTLNPEPLINFGALYLPVSSQILPLIASQLAFYDMDSDHVQLVGSALWHEKSIYKNKGEYIKGAYYPAPSFILANDIQKKFERFYNKKMLPISSLAYDAVKLVTMAYSYSNYNPGRLVDEFYRENGYLLSNGPTKLFENGLTKRLYSLYEVRTFSFIERESSPLAFPPTLPEPLDPREKKSIDSFFNPWGF